MPDGGSRILLLGGDTDHNVGDRAILAALVECIHAHDASAEIATVGRAERGSAIPGLARVIPRGLRGLRRLAAYASSADRILIAGGGLFQDDDSRAKMPYWAARIALLKRLNPRIAAHAIGAGPLRHGESRRAARAACTALTSISVRDRYAQEALAGCTSRPIAIVPDPAFMLAPATPDAASALLRSLDLTPGRPLIVVAIRRWFHARGGWVPNGLKARAGLPVRRDVARFDSLLDTLAQALASLARRLDAGVLLLPSYPVAHEADDVACEALARRIGIVHVRVARIANPRLYKAVIGFASLVVSARMHPLIFAAGMGTPLVGLSYNPKFSGLFELLGISRKPLQLDDFPARWGVRELEAEAEAALARANDLRERADSLAAVVRHQTVVVAFGEAGIPAPEAVNA